MARSVFSPSPSAAAAFALLAFGASGASVAVCSSSDTVYVVGDAGAPAVTSCSEPDATTGKTPSVTTDSTGQSIQSVEWVSYHSVIPFNAGDFHALAAGLFGSDAQAGKFITSKEIAPSIYLTSVADPTTPAQSRVTLQYDDGTPTKRTLAVVPASFDVGTTFVTTIDAAIATMQAEEAQSPGSSESYLLQYQVTSAQGGTFSFGVQGALGVFSLVLDVASPTTNLALKKIGTAATSNTPYDTIAGTVYFHMSKDDFDYFVQHAYGTAAAVGENFSNFELVPHTWLRLTVSPHLTDKYVDVGFKVAATDGTLIPIAKAPASVLAGATFQTMVDRNMANMAAQETAKAGSSFPFQVPFYYDDPNGGGVVQVIVNGNAGVYLVDYAVQSPRHTLVDVPFNAYKPVDFTPPEAGANAACNQLGNPGIVLASEGAFDITFSMSSVILNSTSLTLPLIGDIQCSTYNAADVTVSGPNPGVNALQSFVVKDASFVAGAPPVRYLTPTLPAGSYQILCGQDIYHNGNVGMGDPVTIPISPIQLACNLNPVGIQFALLDPED